MVKCSRYNFSIVMHKFFSPKISKSKVLHECNLYTNNYDNLDFCFWGETYTCLDEKKNIQVFYFHAFYVYFKIHIAFLLLSIWMIIDDQKLNHFCVKSMMVWNFFFFSFFFFPVWVYHQKTVKNGERLPQIRSEVIKTCLSVVWPIICQDQRKVQLKCLVFPNWQR